MINENNTDCVFELPFYENFNATTTPLCWEEVHVEGGLNTLQFAYGSSNSHSPAISEPYEGENMLIYKSAFGWNMFVDQLKVHTSSVEVESVVVTTENDVAAEINQANGTLQLIANPTQGIVNINTDLDLEKVEVYNTLGQNVFVGKVINNTIDLSTQSKGVYIVRLQTTDGQIMSYKLIKK